MSLWNLFGLGVRSSPARRQAQSYAAAIRHELTRLKLSARVKQGNGYTLQAVRWEEPLILTPDELWLPIDRQRLPLGISTSDLRKDEVVQSVQDRVCAPVRIDALPGGKLCFVVRVGAASAFPKTFSINSFQMPPDAPALAFPLGIDTQGEQQVVDLEALPHLAVIGTTGSGKTTFFHTMLTTLIVRNSAQDLQLWLIDLKGGAEFNRYAELMTKQHTGVVRRFAYKPEEALELLQLAEKEVDRRVNLFRTVDASNIRDYARLTGQPLPYIVLVIDEIAQLLTNRTKIGSYTIASHAENLLTRIASLARAAGVHVVFGTQMIETDVITSSIKANFECRVAFSCADDWRSRVAIDDKRAAGLPTGRMIFKRESTYAEYQSCYIALQQTRLLVRQIAKFGSAGGLGTSEAERFLADAKVLLVTACDRLDGAFSPATLIKQEGVQGVIPRSRVEEIARRLEQDGVLESGGPRRPRRVARGYLNRPHLLDALYRPDGPQTGMGSERGVGESADSEQHGANSPRSHPDAVDRGSADDQDTPRSPADGREVSLAGAESRDDDVELPPSWREFIDGVESGGDEPGNNC